MCYYIYRQKQYRYGITRDTDAAVDNYISPAERLILSPLSQYLRFKARSQIELSTYMTFIFEAFKSQINALYAHSRLERVNALYAHSISNQ